MLLGSKADFVQKNNRKKKSKRKDIPLVLLVTTVNLVKSIYEASTGKKQKSRRQIMRKTAMNF